jgi:hypothetical protein
VDDQCLLMFELCERRERKREKRDEKDLDAQKKFVDEMCIARGKGRIMVGQ